MTNTINFSQTTDEEQIFQARHKVERIFKTFHEDGCDFDFISASTNDFGHGNRSVDIEIDVNEAISGQIFPAFFRENATIRHIAPVGNGAGSFAVRIGIRFH